MNNTDFVPESGVLPCKNLKCGRGFGTRIVGFEENVSESLKFLELSFIRNMDFVDITSEASKRSEGLAVENCRKRGVGVLVTQQWEA